MANLAPEADGMSVGKRLDWWLSTMKGTVKERTWARHEEVVRLHLKPSVGHVKLQKLSALDVQELYRTKLESGRRLEDGPDRPYDLAQGPQAGREVVFGTEERDRGRDVPETQQ